MLEEIENLEVEWNKTICIAGARNQGKTNLAQSLLLLNLAPKVDLVLLFGNPGSLTQWEFLVGPGMPHRIYPEVKAEVIEACFRVNGERLQKKKPPIRTLIIFDDSLSRATVHSDIINRVFIHGRIFHIWTKPPPRFSLWCCSKVFRRSTQTGEGMPIFGSYFDLGLRMIKCGYSKTYWSVARPRQRLFDSLVRYLSTQH